MNNPMNSDSPRNVPRNVLITGAASGIGKAVAKALLGDGHKITVVDINAESLAGAKHRLARVDRRCDLARLNHMLPGESSC